MRREVQTRVENERADVESDHSPQNIVRPHLILYFEKIFMISNAEPHFVIETAQVLNCRREQAVYHDTAISHPNRQVVSDYD